MQADQTVLSLRPGGGTRGGSRVFGSRFDSSATSSDRPLLHPHAASSLTSLKVISIPDDILKVKQEVEAEFFGADPTWGRAETTLPTQTQNHYSEPDNCDWCNHSAQSGGRFDSRQQDVNQYNKQEQLNFQLSRAQNSSNQGVAPALIKAEVPWSAGRGSLSEKDRVLKTVKGILNKSTPEKFDILKGQLIDSGITTADILKDVISLIFDTAVLEPTFCPMYALLCSDLNEKLPPFPSDEPGEKEITFKCVLLNNCQEAFEGADKLREEELLGQDTKSVPEEENEAICHLFKTIGKQLDENQKSKCINDMYFNRLKDLSTNPQLAVRLRFMVRDVLDLRANNWVPRREEVKAKTINEIHSEAEKNLGLRPGATAGIRNSRANACGAQGSISPAGFPMNRPGTGGMMPGMPGARKMPGMPGIDNDNWESPLIAKSPSVNKRLLPQGGGGFMSEEYFSVRLLDEALQSVEELKSPAYHPEVVKEAISLGLEKSPPCVEPTGKLLEYLCAKKVLDSKDVATGCLLYAASLDDLAIDFPKAPANFGEIIGALVVAGYLDFKVVRDILAKVGDDYYKKAVFTAVIKTIGDSHSGKKLLDSQASDVTACESQF
ncbi:hypothetical protein SASPL_108904 [Salvia splendens]|uniref:MI domain-containing protein n=1 Tax=Salvia splendens TaxID=180675 RepID=A0A8X8YJ33_SALSN|nr:hypothetical protein SASPL_108904 [Salvia splendens]